MLLAVAYAVLAAYVMLFSLGYVPILLVFVPMALFILKSVMDVYSIKSRIMLDFAKVANKKEVSETRLYKIIEAAQ